MFAGLVIQDRCLGSSKNNAGVLGDRTRTRSGNRAFQEEQPIINSAADGRQKAFSSLKTGLIGCMGCELQTNPDAAPSPDQNPLGAGSSDNTIFYPGFEEWQHATKNAPVRVQWDPEGGLLLQPLPSRAIQIGLSKQAVDLHEKEWILQIMDATKLAHSIHAPVLEKKLDAAKSLLPVEVVYPLGLDQTKRYDNRQGV